MLVSLSIRNIVIIEKLDLSFDRGLVVLTGETGAGKSILLDSLGFALGNRADARLLRPGAEQASVTAAFDIAPTATGDHPARALLAEQGIELEDLLLLRRVLTADGRSRAFVNDQAASAGLLRQLADTLIEIQGQFDQRGLMDPATHRELLDAYGRLRDSARGLRDLWRGWRDTLAARETAAERLAEAQRDETFLRHAVEELDAIDPRAGEEAELSDKRNRLMHREKLVEGMNAATAEIDGKAEPALGRALRALERIAPTAGDALKPALDALQRATAEAEEALAELNSFAGDMEHDADSLESVEERYFALQDMARKHHCAVDALPALRDELAQRLASIDGGEAELTKLARAAAEARRKYVEAAETLSKKRAKAAASLDKAIMAELPPLKLERAAFRTALERLPEDDWSAQGMDRIAFEVATNPGSAPGPLGRIASGGELARFLLAAKVVLASVNPERALVFDEVDSGVGGATAHAVGERLERLAQDRQVLVITHSPQVAARGAHHWQVMKRASGKQVATEVSQLTAGARREEIARMLSGAEITEEARAAAERLIGTG